MNLSLFTGFLFFPFGISVHICRRTQYPDLSEQRIQHASFTFSRTC